jgi:hypothetical protein
VTDDIVARLRAFDNGFVGTHYNHCWHNHPTCAIMISADEIERLRKAGDALAHGIRTGQWDDALDAWTELRGE